MWLFSSPSITKTDLILWKSLGPSSKHLSLVSVLLLRRISVVRSWGWWRRTSTGKVVAKMAGRTHSSIRDLSCSGLSLSMPSSRTSRAKRSFPTSPECSNSELKNLFWSCFENWAEEIPFSSSLWLLGPRNNGVSRCLLINKTTQHSSSFHFFHWSPFWAP